MMQNRLQSGKQSLRQATEMSLCLTPRLIGRLVGCWFVCIICFTRFLMQLNWNFASVIYIKCRCAKAQFLCPIIYASKSNLPYVTMRLCFLCDCLLFKYIFCRAYFQPVSSTSNLAEWKMKGKICYNNN